MSTIAQRSSLLIESMVDGFLAADPGLVRLRFASRIALSVVLALVVLSLVGLPLTNVLLGGVAALVCSSSLRTGSSLERLAQLAMMAPVLAASLSLGTLLAPYRLLGEGVFLVLIFVAVYLRRFAPIGLGLGMAAFMAFFFALFLKAAPSTLPGAYLAIGSGAVAAGLVGLVLFADSPTRELRRLAGALRARTVSVLDEVIDLVRTARGSEPASEVTAELRARLNRLHESALLIEDAITEDDRIELPAHWRRQLTDVELTGQRLCIVAVRAATGGISDADRHTLLGDLRGLRRYLSRDPAAVLSVDEDALLRRLASYDINGDASALAGDPGQRLLLARRAIRELLLAIARLRRTVFLASTTARRAAAEPRDEPAQDDPTEDGMRPSTRQAVQCTVASLLAMIGGELISDQRWYWAVIASFVVFVGTTTRGELMVKGVRRIGGTLLGIVAGTVLASLLAGDTTLSLILVLVCIYLAFYFVSVSYTAMTLLITVMLGLLYDLLGTFTPDLLVLRLTETTVGAGAAIVTAMLLLPARTGQGVRTAAVELLGAVRDFTDAAVGTLVYRRDNDLIDAARDVDRKYDEVRTAAAPVTYLLTPLRNRRNATRDLQNLLEDLASAVRNLAHDADPGAMAGLPQVLRKRFLIAGNIDRIIEVLDEARAPGEAELNGTAALAPNVNARRVANRTTAGTPDRAAALRLRRALSNVDRLDDLVCGIGRALGMHVQVRTEQRPPGAVQVHRHIG